MFRVTHVNLSADGTRADPAFGSTDAVEISEADFIALLDRFAQLDAVQNFDADPSLGVEAPAGRFLIRTGKGRLFLYNARESAEPYAELTPPEIVAQLTRHSATASPFVPASDAVAPSPSTKPRSAPHRGIAAAILIAGVALNGYTLYSVFYTESVDEKPIVTLLTDPVEAAARQRDAVGTFATGDRPGDRAIVVQPDGRIRFFEIGSKNSVVNNSDTYKVGRRASKFCLTTAESGIVDLANIDTVIYYRDTYKRTQ